MVSPTASSPGAGRAAADRAFGPESLHVTTQGPGDGAPVMLLHGWGSSAANMAIIAGALAETYRVYNVDLPGHGRSPHPPSPLGVPEQARLVYRLLKETVGRPATIVGHSNGGRLALFVASDPEMKDMIHRLVLISPSGVKPVRTAGYYLRKYLAQGMKLPFTLLPGKLRAFGLDWLRHSLLWKALGSTDYRALDGVMRDTFVMTVSFHLDDRLERVDVPTLLFWGSEDTAVSRRQMEILETRIPDAGLVVLEGAGHFGYLDDFDTFITATRRFLQSS